MAFTPAGTNLPAHITFNSGTIDFGAGRIVDIDNVSLMLEYTLAPLFVLGSIKPQNYARHTQKVSLTGKVKSFSPTMLAATAGSSAVGSPSTIYTLDGQPTLQNPVATFYDVSNNEFQYQFTNALFKSFKTTLKAEDYLEADFEMEASDVTFVVGAQ